MKAVYFQCAAGISGDMTLGALVDAGVDWAKLNRLLAMLNLPAHLEKQIVLKQGIRTTFVKVLYENENKHRKLADITEIINAAELPLWVKENAVRVFTNLARAEAKVHCVDISEIHFHEVGAVDAIFDIVGSLCCLHLLGVEKIYSSPLPISHGWVDCAHGCLPVPVPAVMELIHGIATVPLDLAGETVTPTGAALITTLATSFGECPPMMVTTTGNGSGTKDYGYANMLRVMVGELAPAATADEVLVLTASLDDCTGEILGNLVEKALQKGALDIYYTPIYMKKNRPAFELTLICPPALADGLAALVLAETTSLGVRSRREKRYTLARETMFCQTPWGEVEVKIGGEGINKNIAPEYESIKKLAEKNGVALKTVYNAAIAAALQKLGQTDI